MIENTDENKNPGDLQGTSISMSQAQEGLSELDAMIAETLNQSKASKQPQSAPKEAPAFAATPISKEILDEAKLSGEPKKIVPLPQEPKQILKMDMPAPQKPEAKLETPKEKPKDQYDATFKQYSVGDIIKGTVVKVDPTGALIDIKYISDGYIPSDELTERKLTVGETIDVYIDSLSTKEGYVALSIKRAEIENDWKTLYESFKQKKPVDTKVTSAVAGGLVVDYKGIRGFVPASHVIKKGESSFADFVGKTVPVQVIEIDRRRSKVVMSHRFGNIEKQQHDKEVFFEHIEVGSILKGTVSSIKKFGAFINVKGIEGLLHINEMSWKRVVDPNKIVHVGQELDVFVIGVDKEARKLSLGLKELQADPWATILEKYKPGQTVEVKILRLTKFGAFAELEEGLEGLIHNSELSAKPVQNAADEIKPGDIVKVVILRIIPDEQKIGLSIREVELQREKEEYKKSQEAHAPKITIGDAISENMKEHLSTQPASPEVEEPKEENELPPAA